jgi:phosphoribosylanthranilate isomerase
MIVKICGITRREDAEIAVAHGAAAIGFVFWPESPRFVDPYRARQIAAVLPPFVSTVGVFVNQSSEYINGVASVVPLAAIQLHGDEPPALAALLSRPVMKAVTQVDGAAVDVWPAHVTLLVDAHDPIKHGGTGARADWHAAASLARRRRVFLAGGLTADNVADAIAEVRPFGIDVSSGVESSPGVKDERRIAALFNAIDRVRVSTS